MAGNGYYKIGLRYYDNTLGRWTQTDPAERAINPMQPAEAQPYNYSGCNPTNQTDPTGALSDCFVSSLGAIAGAIGMEVGILKAGAIVAAGTASGLALAGTGALLAIGFVSMVAGARSMINDCNL